MDWADIPYMGVPVAWFCKGKLGSAREIEFRSKLRVAISS